jgi:hypothetical protein
MWNMGRARGERDGVNEGGDDGEEIMQTWIGSLLSCPFPSYMERGKWRK